MRTYDPKKVKIFFNGVMLTGVADGSMVSIEKREDNITEHVGSQGEVAVAINADITEDATVSLRSDSPSLFYLRNMAKENEIAPFQVIDMNNNIIETCNDAIVRKTPNLEYEKEHSDIDVEFFLGYQPEE